ncbi:uncharacterized protein [Maniola hyperantus]|uniref:uncharacterized protein n=1 Tax=Aphantopus hyperantus TaxID=2795564 RepID=UPI0021425CD6
MPKERDILINIIEHYKDMPFLWDTNDLNYRNRNVRNEGYQVLFNLYKTFDEDATLKILKKKIDNLRSNYLRESKKVRESKHTGNEDVYVPTIWYYDIFSFLDSTTESYRSVRDPIGNEEFQDTSSLSCADNSYTQMNTSITSSTSNQISFKKKKKVAPLNEQKNFLEEASVLINTKEEDWEILGKSIGMQLRDLNKQQHNIARKLISDVIFYATLNKLSEDSFVGVSLSHTNT